MSFFNTPYEYFYIASRAVIAVIALLGLAVTTYRDLQAVRRGEMSAPPELDWGKVVFTTLLVAIPLSELVVSIIGIMFMIAVVIAIPLFLTGGFMALAVRRWEPQIQSVLDRGHALAWAVVTAPFKGIQKAMIWLMS